MLADGVPYFPWWGGPWGEHGICLFDEPLRAGGRSRSGYHVVVPAFEDCNPDLRWGVVTVCRWGGEVVVWGAAARRAVSRVGAVACSHCSGRFGSAGWSFSARARRRRTVPRRVTLMSVLCVRAWPHSMGGMQTCWPWVCSGARQSTRSTMASWRPLPGVVRSRRALTVSLAQSSCRRYQPRVVVGAQPWRVARRRSGSRMVAGLRGGVPRVRGGSAGWFAGVLRVYVDIWLALAGLRRAGRCRVASWVRDRLRGAVVVSWRPADGDGGRVRGGEWVSGRLGHARHGNG